MQGEMTKDQYINRHSRRLRIRYSIYNNEFQIYLRILFLQTAVFIFINKPLRIVTSIIIFNAIRKKIKQSVSHNTFKPDDKTW